MEETKLSDIHNDICKLSENISRMSQVLVTEIGKNRQSAYSSFSENTRVLKSELETTRRRSEYSQNLQATALSDFLIQIKGTLNNFNFELKERMQELGVLIGRIPKEMRRGSRNVINNNINVGSTPTMVLQENPNRDFAVFMNDSDTKIYLYLGQGASVGNGIILSPSGTTGSSYLITNTNLYKGIVTAVHGTAGVKKSITIVEGFFEG